MDVMGLLGSGVFGGMLGGLFRLAPEVLKWLDRKDERAHEREMFKAQVELEKTRGAIKLEEIGAQHQADVDTGVVAAFKSAIEQQTEMVKIAGGWAAKLSAAVRPVMTFYLLLFYGLVKLCLVCAAWSNGTPLVTAIPMVYGAEDMALLAGVVNYWMLDRSLQKRGL